MKKPFTMIGEGLKPEGVNLNVLNILRTLIEDDESVVYIPQDYKRGSAAGYADSSVHMVPSEAGRPIRVLSISSNQERFNFSLMGLVDVMVEEVQDDGSVNLTPKQVFRQYTIVRDGELTMDFIVAKLSNETFNDLRDAGILYYNGASVPKNHNHNPDFIYKVKLSDLPIVSCNWARPIALGLFRYITDDMLATATLKVVKEVINQYKQEGQVLSYSSNGIYEEKRDKASTKRGESYDAPCVTYEISDYDVESKIGDADFIRHAYPDIRALDRYRKSLTDIQRSARFKTRCIVMAIETSKKKGKDTFDWSELEKVPRSKNKVRQSCTVSTPDGDFNLVRTVYTKTINL